MSGLVGTSHSKSKVIGRSKDTAKAWVNFDTGTSIRNSFNVSSLTDNGKGNYDVNLITNMATTDYCTVTTGYNYDINTTARDAQTSNVQVNCWNIGSSAFYDMSYFKVAIFGD